MQGESGLVKDKGGGGVRKSEMSINFALQNMTPAVTGFLSHCY